MGDLLQKYYHHFKILLLLADAVRHFPLTAMRYVMRYRPTNLFTFSKVN